MGFIGWVVLGLIAGGIAKAIVPGDRKPTGCLATMVLGVIGAVVGGWIGSRVFHVGIDRFWSLSTWGLAVLGSVILLFIWGLVTGNRK